MPSEDASAGTEFNLIAQLIQPNQLGGGVLVYTAPHHQRAAKMLVTGEMKADTKALEQEQTGFVAVKKKICFLNSS